MLTPEKRVTFLILLSIIILLGSLNSSIWAHCDRENGPVAAAASKALETNALDPVAIWVGEEQEKDMLNKTKKRWSV